jgi:hypothetical protein
VIIRLNVFIDGLTGDVAATSFTAGGGAVQIDGITGEVTATTFIGDLTGTASYATQALSASWAPAGTRLYGSHLQTMDISLQGHSVNWCI